MDESWQDTGADEPRRSDGSDGSDAAPRDHGAPLSAVELPVLLERVHAALAVQRERIDELNVFPVPDGDTGTNMTLTVQAGLEALRAGRHADAQAAARAVTRGAVRGARGNSGVILSQILRAVVDVVTGHPIVDASLYAAALDRARVLAYDAVAQPVEGTILTVVAAAAGEAAAAVAEGDDLVETSDRVCAATQRAVDATRDQLDVLRDAGVVDAGARGFEVLVAAVHAHLTGEDPPAAQDHADVAKGPYQLECDATGSLSYRYEVQYLLDAPDDVAPGLRDRLELLGDSVVVVGAGDVLNVHVHTDDVGGAIEEGLALGRPSEINVTHFGDQIAARHADTPVATVGVVAVVSGPGVHELATSLGATTVEGAAGRLPSVADLLNACGDVRAETLVILPGHPNALPTARQAADVAVAEGGRPFEVVDDATALPAVLAALAVLDPGAPADGVLEDLRAAAAAVRCGEVVPAVRDADTPIGPVTTDQPLAVVGGRVVAATDDPLDALAAVLDELGAGDAEIVTLLLGRDAPRSERERAEELVRSTATAADVEVVDAGQHPARYAVGVE
ncbi:DAK2 domain-containing protein [Nitriliruptor alkaliphilus]|uniref:DAK2 domain-containing protein n=1 Tax=Nitriliruptor alkaliphilus TaxID=427918 RepID=UPI000697376F|nr:DAK2 domain-containing protein [Nitriliruptor alkaliphilus]